ncbi:TetR/AcrR family transcriptional regulator [Microbacterium oleivorans]|uniref:TetR/AcrR family transcriptional regulator n=1 Tax=Microbacterium oleivorans TaxID=273677 RepID=A0A7D5F7Y4_9MICO|nr:TetR/AcrR family transcriptional regulator [Microbacterium oleivorans]QLD11249.1 TetR/AcrR family transcriptional regulator [Microbacterium oleivorans]
MDAEGRPSTRSRENTRARLLDAAAEVFGEVGLDAASVEAVCDRAGFTRGAFYSNFASKDELFLALVERSSSEKLDRVADRVRGLDRSAEPDPASLVPEVVGVSLAGMEPRLVSELRAQAIRDERMAAAYLRLQDGIVDRVHRIIEDIRSVYGLRFRIPTREVANLMVDLSDATCERAAIQGLGEPETTELLHARIGVLATALLVD